MAVAASPDSKIAGRSISIDKEVVYCISRQVDPPTIGNDCFTVIEYMATKKDEMQPATNPCVVKLSSVVVPRMKPIMTVRQLMMMDVFGTFPAHIKNAKTHRTMHAITKSQVKEHIRRIFNMHKPSRMLPSKMKKTPLSGREVHTSCQGTAREEVMNVSANCF